MRYTVESVSVPRDEFGPECVYAVMDNDIEIGWVVIDNTWRSPTMTGKGGTAMYSSCDLAITCKKARVMTWKQVFCVPIGEKPLYSPWGGAKGGIRGDYKATGGKEKLRAWARALYDKGVIPDRYIFGLDVGLNESAARAVVHELGNNPKVSTGKPVDLGGIPYDELGITGLGLVEALKVMCAHRGTPFSPRTTLAIQGFGAVGKGFMRWLGELPQDKRPRVIAVSDMGGAMYCKSGFDPVQTLATAHAYGTVACLANAQSIPLGSELLLDVDILVLAYKEDQITAANMRDVRADIILQGANLCVSRDAEEYLHSDGVLMLPDFVVNAGASAIVYVEYAGGNVAAGIDYVRKVISHNARIVLDAMTVMSDGREVAQVMAQDQVRNAPVA